MSELSLDPVSLPSQEQEQDQGQRLIVSPKHQQAIELLEYPTQELSSWINEKLQENPLLERDRDDDILEPPEDEIETEDSPLDEVNLDELVNRGEDYNVQRGGGSPSTEHPEFQMRAMAAQHQTLHDSLEWQLSLRNLADEDREWADRLLSHINEDGLFEGELERIAEDKNVSVQKLESLLGVIQEFAPPGVGGRDLTEVLLIQLRRESGKVSEVHEEILTDHLEDLQNRSFKKIAREVGVDASEVQGLADRVHDLEPRPGRVHEPVNRKYITPDVVIRNLEDDRAVIINDEAPPLTISSHYRQLLDSDDEETREYVEDKLKGALWIIHCIHQRHETLQKVTETIAEFQSEFFEEGVQALKPLVLEDVAEAVDVHESTVSRAVKDKYVQTNQGLFPLDFFFSSKLETEGDRGPVSSTAVKAKIKELVEGEDPTDPLNDRELKEQLNEQGIRIQRRTISKYRKELLIPPWKLRKRVE
jgi:RNA polymerase sigma-54 factor